ncbi:MAG: fatty acid desaturase family protein [Candidatus Binatia bacterium]
MLNTAAEERDSFTPPQLRHKIKSLSRVSLLVSLYHLLEVWLIVGLAVYCSVVVLPPTSSVGGGALYLLVVAIIASRQHALMVLTHEAIHKRLARPFWLNDWIARFVAAFPIFISLSKWRFIHLYHHQYTHTAADPDRAIYGRYPLTRTKFFRVLVRDTCGLNVIATLKYFIDIPFLGKGFNRRFLGKERESQYQRTADMRAFALFWITVVGIGVAVGGTRSVGLFVCYWLVPYCTITQILFRIRGAIEHGSVPNPGDSYRQTRTYLINPVCSFFFSPKKVNYHLEHHLYPSVPFYNLPRLHKLLQREIYPSTGGYCETFLVGMAKLITK